MTSRADTALRLNASLSGLPLLDEKQAGSLRHYHNLMAQLDGDWSRMQGDDPDNVSDESGYRYQLGYMAYAMALAHFHRLPAAPGVFKKTFERAITKMMRREVWGYWYGMSQSGPGYDPEITEPRKQWWDPVVKENIMYSGHLNAMTALYNYLFDDDKYDQMGSIRFNGGVDAFNRGATVEYSLQTLNEQIYWQLVETGFVGVACQPNLIFAICNQFPLWGFRFDDIRKGTNKAEEIAAKHTESWRNRGGYHEGQAMPFMVRQRQDAVWDADWSGGYHLINSWNPDYFHSVYDLAKKVLLCRDEMGALQPRPVSQSGKSRHRIAKGEAPPPLDRTLDERPGATAMMTACTAMTLREGGDHDLLDELLAYADANMAPVWDKGGYYYPRNDERWGKDGNFHGVCPVSGNVTFGWARLNVEGGLRALYSKPWTKAHFSEPNLADVSEDVDVLRAVFSDNRLAMTIKPMHGAKAAKARLDIANIRRQGQSWTLFVGDETVASGDAERMKSKSSARASFADGVLTVNERVSGPTDVVVAWS